MVYVQDIHWCSFYNISRKETLNMYSEFNKSGLTVQRMRQLFIYSYEKISRTSKLKETRFRTVCLVCSYSCKEKESLYMHRLSLKGYLGNWWKWKKKWVTANRRRKETYFYFYEKILLYLFIICSICIHFQFTKMKYNKGKGIIFCCA